VITKMEILSRFLRGLSTKLRIKTSQTIVTIFAKNTKKYFLRGQNRGEIGEMVVKNRSNNCQSLIFANGYKRLGRMDWRGSLEK